MTLVNVEWIRYELFLFISICKVHSFTKNCSFPLENYAKIECMYAWNKSFHLHNTFHQSKHSISFVPKFQSIYFQSVYQYSVDIFFFFFTTFEFDFISTNKLYHFFEYFMCNIIVEMLDSIDWKMIVHSNMHKNMMFDEISHRSFVHSSIYVCVECSHFLTDVQLKRT